MLREDLQDAGQIIQHILTQSIEVPGVKGQTSLLKAAKDFDAKSPLASDLHKILLSFLQFPEPTEMMIRELELLQDELIEGNQSA